MQTFLAYPSYEQSAKVLDYRRLGKQRIEAKQLYQVLEQGPQVLYSNIANKIVYGPIPTVLPEYFILIKTPWYNHPAARMWRGSMNELAKYGLAICEEWISRGYNDNQLQWFESVLTKANEPSIPSWIGYEPFHLSHQSNLIRKDAAFYQPVFPGISDNLNYFWPENKV